jgi:hypothetical protein
VQMQARRHVGLTYAESAVWKSSAVERFLSGWYLRAILWYCFLICDSSAVPTCEKINPSCQGSTPSYSRRLLSFAAVDALLLYAAPGHLVCIISGDDNTGIILFNLIFNLFD